MWTAARLASITELYSLLGGASAMKRNYITEGQAPTYLITGNRQEWLFEDGRTFSSTIGPAIDLAATNRSVVILEGTAKVTNGHAAIEGAGTRSTVVVTDQGSIVSDDTGIRLSGRNSEVDFRGDLQARYSGIDASGDGFHLNNSGVISARHGVTISGAGASITNGEAGVIQGTIIMSGAAGETMWFNNHGSVSPCDRNAVHGGDSDDIIFNAGDLIGFISLGAGDDVLDTRFGRLGISHVASGSGDDTLVTGSARYVLNEVEDEGYDSVRSTASYTLSDNVEKLDLLGTRDINATGNAEDNSLVGNRVNNELNGLGGDDRLKGGKGNDVLTGDDGMDTFVFGSGFDMDTVIDFTHGEDTIDLSGWKAVDSFRDFRRHAENHGDDLWIIAGKDMLVIENQQKADMHKEDFLF